MKFGRVEGPIMAQGVLVYRPEEYSFAVEGNSVSGVTSLLLDDLQLETDREGRLLYPWGLCPHTMWRSTTAMPPPYSQGAVRAIAENELTPGVSWRVPHVGRWPVSVNQGAGWVCVGDPKQVGATREAIEILPGCVVVLNGNQLGGLWLRPRVLPTLTGGAGQ